MDAKPSKSARKREAQAVERLASRLLAMRDAELERLPLDAELRELLASARAIRSRSAARRQRLYLAKRLRQADTTALEAAFATLDAGRGNERRLFHAAEQWRDRLLAEPAEFAGFCELTGRREPRLAELVEAGGRSPGETERKRLGRELFRAVHAELDALMQRDAASI